jgi:hypothetical protein
MLLMFNLPTGILNLPLRLFDLHALFGEGSTTRREQILYRATVPNDRSLIAG